MEKDDYYNFYHVDISTQIDNKWKEDTVLGIVRDSERYSVKIKGRDKLEVKRRFIREENSRSSRIHNKKVIAIIYSYLLYKALFEFDAKPLLLCRDVRPEKFVTNYLQKIVSFFKNYRVLDRKIKFRKRIEFGEEKLPKSLAGKYTRKVYQGKLPASKTLDSQEIQKLIEIIGKIL